MSERKKKTNNPYVTQQFCDERFNRISDSLKTINIKLDEIRLKNEETSHFWRNFAGSVVGGIIVGAIVYLISVL